MSPVPLFNTAFRQYSTDELVYVFIDAYGYENSIQLFSMYLYSGMHWIEAAASIREPKG
jgi:hypothetical protein